MKILFVITRADTVAGAQVHVRDLARFLQDSHHQVLVVTGTKGIYNDDLTSRNITHVSCQHFGK
ncbi:MAG: glycosyltransferase family 1 protein, partial [Chroococcales cyanobacterium metabat2.561]